MGLCFSQGRAARSLISKKREPGEASEELGRGSKTTTTEGRKIEGEKNKANFTVSKSRRKDDAERR